MFTIWMIGAHQEPEKKRVGEEAANRQRSGKDLVRADVHDHSSHDTHEQAGGQAHHTGRRECPHHIFQQPSYS
jgi:hypothetical protein